MLVYLLEKRETKMCVVAKAEIKDVATNQGMPRTDSYYQKP